MAHVELPGPQGMWAWTCRILCAQAFVSRAVWNLSTSAWGT